MKSKLFLWILSTAILAACSSAQVEEPLEAAPQRDPALEHQAQTNEKLYNQTAQQMAKSLKVPAITYEFDSILPPQEAYPLLDKIAQIMKDNTTLHLIVEGHTDIVGGAEYNYWLGAARATAMKSYLVSRGINAERIRVHSHGKDRPITLDTSTEGRRANRRVEFTFTKRNWNAIY